MSFTPQSLMATPKLFFFFVFLVLRFASISSHKTRLEPEDAISSLKIEVEQLKTKISILESTIEKNDHELKSKDDDMPEMENCILEKSESMVSPQNKIETLQFQKASYEQDTGIHGTEEDLRVAEKEMVKTELVATFMKSVMSFIVAHWKIFWRPALDASFQKILVKLLQVRRDGETCIETLKTEWIPVMKDQWLTFITSLGPHFESLTAKAIEVYYVTKNSFLSHTIEVQQAAAPFIQQAQEFAKPYVSQTGTVAKRYIDMAVITLEPYAREPVYAYRLFVTSVISYHKQVEEMLKSNELTRSIASMEVAWFVATALLCLPVVFVCRLYSAIFRKKAKKFGSISESNHSRRKSKRHRNIE